MLYCDVADGLSWKIYVLRKIEDANVKVFNIVTITDESKAFVKNISCGFKCKLNSTACNSNQKWNSKTLFKNCRTCKKDYSYNPSTRIQESDKYLESIADTLVMPWNCK